MLFLTNISVKSRLNSWIETPLIENMPKNIVLMEIEKVTWELEDTKTLRLKWPEDYEPIYKTGQFITLYWPDCPKYKRAYSLSSSALDRGFFEVTIKRDGKMGTRMVDWAEEGQKLHVIPPVGRFLPVFEPDKHLVCIAGGSGVTPFRGFAREATQSKLTTRMTLLYSVRTPKDIIFRDEFTALEAENPHFQFQVTCTRADEADAWQGRRGRIDADWITEKAGNLSAAIFYACGPTTLVEATESLIRDTLKLPKEQIKLEKWG